MFIEKCIPKRIKLTEAFMVPAGVFTKGHEFNVIGITKRGFDLKDDDGRFVFETGLTLKYEIIDPCDLTPKAL